MASLSCWDPSSFTTVHAHILPICFLKGFATLWKSYMYPLYFATLSFSSTTPAPTWILLSLYSASPREDFPVFEFSHPDVHSLSLMRFYLANPTSHKQNIHLHQYASFWRSHWVWRSTCGEPTDFHYTAPLSLSRTYFQWLFVFWPACYLRIPA